jgi:hypothetical protein
MEKKIKMEANKKSPKLQQNYRDAKRFGELDDAYPELIPGEQFSDLERSLIALLQIEHPETLRQDRASLQRFTDELLFKKYDVCRRIRNRKVQRVLQDSPFLLEIAKHLHGSSRLAAKLRRSDEAEGLEIIKGLERLFSGEEN